ncbi:MAG: hypothetical protein HDR97_00410 [Bacteroides sp.]|nr:hypothetical protein [Bacteroides sp.]
MITILKYVGERLLFAFAVAVFISLVAILGTSAAILIDVIGKWIGIGKDIFSYVVLFVANVKAWDFLAWIVGKIADRDERKKEREYFERKNKLDQ